MSTSGQSSSGEMQKPVEKIKRPLNAFILWSKKRRRIIANENPQMHNFDISRKLGLEWQKLSEDEKARYFEEAKQLKEEHKQQYPNYKYQPRKRDKANKRSKLLHGSPFHFSFFPGEGPALFDSRCHLPLMAEPRAAHAAPAGPNLLLHSPEPAAAATSSMSHSGGPAKDSPGLSMYAGLSRQNACESAGFVPYRAPAIDPACVGFRPAFDLSALSWYQSASASRLGPYCGRVFPWQHPPPPRQTDFHSAWAARQPARVKMSNLESRSG